MIDDDTLTLAEAARLAKMHPSTLKAKARSGEAPGYKPGRAWVFFDSEFRQWIRGQHPRDDRRGASIDVAVNRACSNGAARRASGQRGSSRRVAARYAAALGLRTSD